MYLCVFSLQHGLGECCIAIRKRDVDGEAFLVSMACYLQQRFVWLCSAPQFLLHLFVTQGIFSCTQHPWQGAVAR